MSEIKIINAKKIYHDVPVIDNLNITIPKGSLFTILGPSGCGKTTLLRMIAGFNSIEGGEFYFDDTKINNMEPSKRNIGMVFQNYAIFPHLTVRDNVSFGLKQKKVPKEELIQQTNKYLELMQIAQYADRKPDKLSGGQQQLPDTEAASSRTTDTNALNKRRPTPQLSGRFFFIAILGLCFYCGLRASAGKCGTESAEASPGKVFTKTKLKGSEKSRGKAATLRLLHPRKRLFHCLSITSQRTMK